MGNEKNEELLQAEQEILSKNRIECLGVADTLSDLKLVRELYAEGKKDEAFDALVGFVEGMVRMNPVSKGYVSSDEVDRDGNVNEDAVAERGRRRLVMEGYGPRARAARFGSPQIVK